MDDTEKLFNDILSRTFAARVQKCNFFQGLVYYHNLLYYSMYNIGYNFSVKKYIS